jgi:hypothetical protein
MPTKNNPPAISGQGENVIDFYAHMLREGRAPPLDDLLALAPPEPLGPPEDGAAQWPARVLRTRAQFPGYQPGYWYREALKYGDARSPLAKAEHAMPAAGAPLSEFVKKRLQHARALWSAEVGARKTLKQFVDWLRDHVDGKTLVAPLWPDNPGWAEALQILRLSFGLPRFPATKPRRAG